MLDRYDVAEWALKSGFAKIGCWSFWAPYDTFNVVIELGFRGVTTCALRADGKDVLVRVHYADIELDENGMLHGAGLNSEFVNRVARGQPYPRWFPPRHRHIVRDLLNKKCETSRHKHM